MSKRHHATRRRVYGRRQHELQQRPDLALLPARREPAAATPDQAREPDRHARRDEHRTGLTFGYGD